MGAERVNCLLRLRSKEGYLSVDMLETEEEDDPRSSGLTVSEEISKEDEEEDEDKEEDEDNEEDDPR